MILNFADALIERTRALGHPLCVGLDPHLERIPAPFRQGAMDPRDPATPDAVGAFLAEVVDRLEKRVAIVKPQIAFFEQLGWQGLRVLEDVVVRCRARGLMVLLDAKRGDIGSTADGYAQAYLAANAALGVDAITINPYLGRDSLQPFVECCVANGRGMFVLVKTSNPGSGDLQDCSLEEGPLFETVAEMLVDDCQRLRGNVTGWSSLGVVVGAAFPEQAERVRSKLPHALFLVPGFGAQGATADHAVRGFRTGPNGLEGGIVNSSRAILFPDGGDSDSDWEIGFEAALDKAIDQIGNAICS